MIRNMTLEELIERLRLQPATNIVETVLGYAGELVSYRGYYDQLAIVVGGPSRYVNALLRDLEEAAEGNTIFHGYKGGEYRMYPHTPVWLVHSFSATSQATIADVVCEGGTTWLEIGRCPW